MVIRQTNWQLPVRVASLNLGLGHVLCATSTGAALSQKL